MLKLITAITLFSTVALSASAATSDLKCVDNAVKSTVRHNFKNFGVSTNSCGIKLLHAGTFKETFLVCTTDETDGMEYIVVMEKKACKAVHISSTNEGETPAFADNNGLLNSVECSIDEGDEKLVCK